MGQSKRCQICNCKLSTMVYICKCGGQYCSAHRYHDTHNCSYNYKEEARKQIAENNPIVAHEKVGRF
jgi:hypothetical protein